jgi:hypothetical protein
VISFQRETKACQDKGYLTTPVIFDSSITIVTKT